MICKSICKIRTIFINDHVGQEAMSVDFRAQLLLKDSPLLTFFCFISCSMFVSDSSWANAIGFVDNIPANAAAIKTAAMTSV